jgi:hypothetical protein
MGANLCVAMLGNGKDLECDTKMYRVSLIQAPENLILCTGQKLRGLVDHYFGDKEELYKEDAFSLALSFFNDYDANALIRFEAAGDDQTRMQAFEWLPQEQNWEAIEYP